MRPMRLHGGTARPGRFRLKGRGTCLTGFLAEPPEFLDHGTNNGLPTDLDMTYANLRM